MHALQNVHEQMNQWSLPATWMALPVRASKTECTARYLDAFARASKTECTVDCAFDWDPPRYRTARGGGSQLIPRLIPRLYKFVLRRRW